jgi:hypothetical protein
MSTAELQVGSGRLAAGVREGAGNLGPVFANDQLQWIVAHLQALARGKSRGSFYRAIDPHQPPVAVVPTFPIVGVVGNRSKPAIFGFAVRDRYGRRGLRSRCHESAAFERPSD